MSEIPRKAAVFLDDRLAYHMIFAFASGLVGYDFTVVQGVVEEEADQLVPRVAGLIGQMGDAIQCILGDPNGKYFISVRAARAFFFDLQLVTHLYHLFFHFTPHTKE